MKKNNVKNWLISALLSVVCAFALFFGVVTINGTSNTYAADATTEEAMTEFLQKIEAQNYVIDHHTSDNPEEDQHTHIEVCSENLTYWTSNKKINLGDPDHLYDGYAIMTTQDDETFLGYLYDGAKDETSVERVKFLSKKSAKEMLAKVTLSHWLDVENIWDVIYGGGSLFPGEPYKYVAIGDENVIVQSLKSITKYGGSFGGNEIAKAYLNLTFDGEDLVQAELAGYDDEDNYLDKTRIVVTFENAEPDARAAAWMENPNTSDLEVRKSWGSDKVNLSAIFLQGYEEKAFPFPSFATYAFSVDIENVLSKGEFVVSDSRATQSDVNSYIQKLLKNGFEKVVEGKNTYYRRMLREENKCYSQLEIAYDNGVTIVATKYFDFPTFNTFGETNKKLQESGFPLLDALGENLSFVSARDTSFEMLESWLYFFDYETVLWVEISFENETDIEAYLQNYVSEKLGEFTEVDTSGDEYEEEYDEVEGYLQESVEKETRFGQIASDGKYWRLENRDGVKTFKYHDNRDENPESHSACLLFKFYKYKSNEEIKAELAQNGFPEIDDSILEKITTARDLRLYNKNLNGENCDLCLNIDFQFADRTQTEDFMDEYFENLTENEGFVTVIPQRVGMKKETVFCKTVEGVLYLIGVDCPADSTKPVLEFRVDITPKRIWWKNTDTVEDVDIKDVFDEAGAIGRGVELNIQEAKVSFDYVAAKKIAQNTEVLFSFVSSADVSNSKVDGAFKILNVSISGFTEGKATVEIPLDEEIPNGKVLKVYYVDANGKTTDMNAKVVDGKAVFETTHFSEYVIAYESESTPKSGRPLGTLIGLVLAAILILGFAIYSGYYVFGKRK